MKNYLFPANIKKGIGKILQKRKGKKVRTILNKIQMRKHFHAHAFIVWHSKWWRFCFIKTEKTVKFSHTNLIKAAEYKHDKLNMAGCMGGKNDFIKNLSGQKIKFQYLLFLSIFVELSLKSTQWCVMSALYSLKEIFQIWLYWL